MILYGFPLSPFVRKVAVVLAEKGLAFDWVPSNPGKPDAEFLEASPFGKIPGFADGDYRLADSSAIVAYLDALHPDPAVIPAEPKARGQAIWFDEAVDTVMIPTCAPIVVNRFLKPVVFGSEGDEEAALAAEQAVAKPLDHFEGRLGEDGWLGGEYSIGDIALACTFKTLSYAGWSIDAAGYPRLSAWYARVAERPAWQAVTEREAAVFASLKG